MKNAFYLIICLLALTACGEPSESVEDTNQKFELTEEGLPFVHLGAALDSLQFPKGSTVEEELITEGGYQWRVLTVFLPGDHKIQIDGDFVDENDPGNRLPYSRVNRIHVDNPAYPTQEGLKVGDTFADMIEVLGKEGLEVTYIPNYEVIDISAPATTRLHYNLNDDSGEISKMANGEITEVPVEKIPLESKIISIVVL